MMPDDDHTLCSETSSICSDSNNSASSFVSHDAYDELPPLCVLLPTAPSHHHCLTFCD
jgi:hypothetical protein